jgi:hypothetical protein
MRDVEAAGHLMDDRPYPALGCSGMALSDAIPALRADSTT